MVTPEENNFLLKVLDVEEVRHTVFEMDPLIVPGSDCFTRTNFQHCWDIVRSNVVSTVQQFYYSSYYHPGLNSSFLILIPKVDNAISIYQFARLLWVIFFLRLSQRF